MKRLIVTACMFLAVGAWGMRAEAQPSKDELKAQFKAREADLRELKKNGQVGETIDGYVDPVDSKSAGDEKAAKVVREENKDRRALYQLLADEINKESPKAPVKATVDTIAARNAQRNIARAGPEEFLRVGKDQWIRAKDYPRFEKLTRLKTQGKVGETSEGKVEVVRDSDRADKTLSGLVDEENTRRGAEAKLQADKERSDAAAIMRRNGERNIQNARIGEMVKDGRGAWRKK